MFIGALHPCYVIDGVAFRRRSVNVTWTQIPVEVEREDDGRWLAEVTAVPGALAYGATPAEAAVKAQALALRALAERLEQGDPVPEIEGLFVRAA